MSITKVDTRGLQRKIAALRRASPQALEECDRKVAESVMADVILEAPRDTNRFVRAMAEAANDCGLGPFTLPPLKPGRIAAGALPRLERQLAKWQWIVSEYERKGRTRERFYPTAVRTRDRALQELLKWVPDAVIIFGGKGRRLEVTVRNKVYGGSGLKIVAEGSVKFLMHNKEPHASIVESKSRVLRVAMAKARTFGLVLGGRAYTRRLAQAAGMPVGGGRGRSAP